MSGSPAISVIMVTYNCAKYLPLAIGSILDQDFRDLELIVLDNASTDETPELLRAIQDPRLRIERSESNGGPPAANGVMPLARGKYIARLDADDIALPGRLRRQYEYLEAHPEVGLCGTDYDMIDQSGAKCGVNRDVHDPEIICWKLGWINFIGHSTVMMRRDLFQEIGGYDETHWCAEDYDLISRFSRQVKVGVLAESLVQYRVHPTSITFQREQEMRRMSLLVSKRHLEHFLGEPLDEETALAAIEVMRHRAVTKPVRWNEVLRLIVRYTVAQARRISPAGAAIVRSATAKQLLEYARDHCGGDWALRWKFEKLVIGMDSRVFIDRISAALARLGRRFGLGALFQHNAASLPLGAP